MVVCTSQTTHTRITMSANSEETFLSKLGGVGVGNDAIMVSFDVKSLFISMPKTLD